MFFPSRQLNLDFYGAWFCTSLEGIYFSFLLRLGVNTLILGSSLYSYTVALLGFKGKAWGFNLAGPRLPPLLQQQLKSLPTFLSVSHTVLEPCSVDPRPPRFWGQPRIWRAFVGGFWSSPSGTRFVLGLRSTCHLTSQPPGSTELQPRIPHELQSPSAQTTNCSHGRSLETWRFRRECTYFPLVTGHIPANSCLLLIVPWCLQTVTFTFFQNLWLSFARSLVWYRLLLSYWNTVGNNSVFFF